MAPSETPPQREDCFNVFIIIVILISMAYALSTGEGFGLRPTSPSKLRLFLSCPISLLLNLDTTIHSASRRSMS